MVHRKIEMKLVKNKSARLVTFSKRKNGLFKKASELSILCGVDVGMVVFSLGGKPFSFGHPSIEAVTNKFLNQGPESVRGHNCEPSKDDNLEKLNHQLEDLMDQLQVEKNEGEILDNALNKKKLIKGKLPFVGLNLEELQKLKASLEELSDNLKLTLNEMEAASSLVLLAEKPVKETKH